MFFTEGPEYYHSMDQLNVPVDNTISGIEEFGKIASIKSVGPSKWLTGNQADPVQGLSAEIRKGAAQVEITAPGAGRGDQGNPTFEYIDKGKAEEMRMLAKINKVNITTHSSPSAWGLAGFRGQNFDKAQQQSSMFEIRKAIDFAADVANGGSVVIHTGEFPRAFTSNEISKGDNQFRAYSDEAEDTAYHLVFKKDGHIISSVRRNDFIFVPEEEMGEDGKPMYLKKADDTDALDDITGEKIPVYKIDKENQAIMTRKLTFDEFKQELQRSDPSIKEDEDVAKAFYMRQQQARVQYQLGQARHYEGIYIDGMKDRQKMLDTYKYYEAMKKSMDPAEWAKVAPSLAQQVAHTRSAQDARDPLQAIELNLIDNEKTLAYGREITLSARRETRQMLEELKENVRGIKEYALDRSSNAYADLALYAYDKTRIQKTEKPIKITMENVYPETYGSTADELINLVKQTRERFTDRLVKERKMSQDDAKKKAEEHIQVTLDTGHMNMWRKYFQQKEGETPEGADKRFKKWYLDQIEKIAKEGMVGHLHLADNFGYDDAHLVVGQGNVPIKDVMEILTKYNFKDKIAVEGGFNQGREGFLEVWGMMGSPMYGINRQFAPGFQQFHRQHMGYAAPPNYIVGAYAPSNEWKLWSEVPFE